MKQLIFVLLFFLSFLIACGPQHTPSVSGKEHSDENRVLDSVLQRKKLKAVTDYGSVTYLI